VDNLLRHDGHWYPVHIQNLSVRNDGHNCSEKEPEVGNLTTNDFDHDEHI
jgi:hypothetical protein